MIRAITFQGSVTANQICPFRLCGAGRGGDPDLPVSAQLHPSLSVCVLIVMLVQRPFKETPGYRLLLKREQYYVYVFFSLSVHERLAMKQNIVSRKKTYHSH